MKLLNNKLGQLSFLQKLIFAGVAILVLVILASYFFGRSETILDNGFRLLG